MMADPAAHAAREGHQRHEGLPHGLVTVEDASEAFLIRDTADERVDTLVEVNAR